MSNIIPYLQECSTEIEAAGYIKFLAQQLVIDEGLIRGEYRKKVVARPLRNNTVPQTSGQYSQPVPSVLEQAESNLLLLFFRYSGMIDFYREILQQIGFVSPVRQSIYEKICKLENADFSMVKESLFAVKKTGSGLRTTVSVRCSRIFYSVPMRITGALQIHMQA